MRKIKFRVWDKENKKWQDLEGIYNMPQPQYIGDDYQFTGLHDKNGKEIYEGGIVKFHNLDDYLNKEEKELMDKIFNEKGNTLKDEIKSNEISLVEWNCDGWKTKFTTEKFGKTLFSLGTFAEKELEVIGNIYSNPELLK